MAEDKKKRPFTSKLYFGLRDDLNEIKTDQKQNAKNRKGKTKRRRFNVTTMIIRNGEN